ncbi:MAG: TonB family protein [Candidatus Acidiferrales bacterium]
MRHIGFVVLLFSLFGNSGDGGREALCVKHIESPGYGRVARAAHVVGVVVLSVTIDPEGKVIQAELVSGSPLLSNDAIENVRSWIFKRPEHSPVVQRIVYEYRMEGEASEVGISNATFDLPDHVRIVVNPPAELTIEAKPGS